MTHVVRVHFKVLHYIHMHVQICWIRAINASNTCFNQLMFSCSLCLFSLFVCEFCFAYFESVAVTLACEPVAVTLACVSIIGLVIQIN